MSGRTAYTFSDQHATYFLTLTVVGWVDLFSRKECKEILMDSFKYCLSQKGLIIHAYVIMSSDVYLIASASETSDGLSAVLRDMKKFTSKLLLNWVLTSGKES